MSWEALDAELDRWQGDGRRATLWWRDDDACRDTRELRRLVTLAAEVEAPLALAVIPAAIDASLAAALASHPHVTPIQHGYAHHNHAPPGARKSELGAERPVAAVASELEQGRALLAREFAGRFAAVLVPPWNRIAPEVAAVLPAIGFRGLSTFGARSGARGAPSLVLCNTHVELVDWRGHRGFVGARAAVAALVAHLAARRERRADSSEPTGILSHHLVHDEVAWRWLRELFEHTRGRVEWLDAASAFACA